MQGALIDFFASCPAAPSELRLRALEIASARLSVRTRQAFGRQAGAPDAKRCSVLATRWSVWVSPSLDVPRRTLRCSIDDSRQLADAAIAAFEGNDVPSQEAFLSHCTECGDVLAFMLARRVLMARLGGLPARWEAASSFLQREKLR